MVSTVHQAAGTGYAQQADAYTRGRPSYTRKSVTWILEQIGHAAPGPIADVGAGAGALSRLLGEQDAPVVAVEPVAAMLERCPAAVARVRAVAGRLPMPDGALGGVTVATAFHWFATTDVLDEWHRALAPDTTVVLAWNARDDRVPWVAEHTALVDGYAGDAPRFATMRWHDVIAAHPGFEERATVEIANPTPSGRQGLVDRVLSTSFIAALADDEQAAVRARAEALAAGLPETFDYPYLTRMWAYRRR